MKKLTTLLFMLLFAAGMALGQNNDADIDQIGSGNSSDIEQDLNFGQGHTARTLQDGNDNMSTIFQEQFDAEAFISQVGDDNIADLKQAGDNDADVRFTGNSNILGSYSNLGSGTAFQKNGTPFTTQTINELDIDAVGNNNLFGVDQEAGNYAKVNLMGNRNEISLYQRDDNASADITVADVFVDGNRNTLDINQGILNITTNNLSDVRIVGNDNMSTILQSTSNNVADVNVLGNGNTSSVIQN